MATNDNAAAMPVTETGDIAPEKLDEFCNDYEELNGRKNKATSEIANLLKNGENTYGLHKKAFKLVMQLKSETPQKRADFMRAFAIYYDHFDLNAQPDMFDGQQAEAAE